MSERKPAPNVDGMFTLKVDGISDRTTPESLKEKFGAHGEIGDVYIPRSYGSTDSRGYAFVRFLDKKDAEDAQRVLDGTDLDGRVIKIQEARERRPDNPRDAMANRGYSRNGGRDSGYRGRDDYRRDDRYDGRRDRRSRSRSYDRASRRSYDRRRSRSRSYDRDSYSRSNRGGSDRDRVRDRSR